MTAPTSKPTEITIKINTLKRTLKELAMYQAELDQEQLKLESITEPHAHRKQLEVIEETKQMIPDTKKRLEKAMQELRNHEEGIAFLETLEQ